MQIFNIKWIPPPYSAIPYKNKQFCRGFFMSFHSLSESLEPLVHTRPKKAESCMPTKHSLSISVFHSHYATLQGDSLKTFWRCKPSFHLQVISEVCHSQSVVMQLWCSHEGSAHLLPLHFLHSSIQMQLLYLQHWPVEP